MGNKRLLDKALEFDKFNNLIHIGAHLGQEVTLYQQYDFNNVFLVEPIAECVEVIKKKIKTLEKYKVFNYAMGSRNGTVNLFIADGNSDSSSILTPRESSITFSEEREVELRTFDSLQLETVDFAVIDTQGYEIEVLKGFNEKIYDLNFAIVEFANYEGYMKQPKYKEIKKFMKKKGFIVVDQIKKIDSPFPSIKKGSYGDALFVSSEYLSKSQKVKYSILSIFLNNVFTDLYIYTLEKLKKIIKKLLRME